jgi:hypothetical protein
MQVELSAGLLPIPMAEGFNMCKRPQFFFTSFVLWYPVGIKVDKKHHHFRKHNADRRCEHYVFLKHPPCIGGKIGCSKASPNYTTEFQGGLYMCYVHVLWNTIYWFAGRPCSGAIHKIACPQGHYERLESLQHLLLEMSRLKRLCIHAGDRDSRLAWIGNLLLISSSSINAN